MANVGKGPAGYPLTGRGTASPSGATFLPIGSESGLTAHGVVLAQGNGAFVATAVGTTGQVLTSNGPGVDPTYQSPVSQVSFSAYLSTPQGSVTGDGTIYTVPFDTALSNIGGGFNTGTGVFTAPITGNYQFNYTITFENTGASTAFIAAFKGTNFDVRSNQSSAANVFSGTLIVTGGIVLPMTAGDTMFITAAAFGSTKTVNIYGMAPTSYATASMFSGFLVK